MPIARKVATPTLRIVRADHRQAPRASWTRHANMSAAETTRQPAMTARLTHSCRLEPSIRCAPYLNTSAKLRGRTSAWNHSSAGTGPRRVALRRFQSALNSHAGAAESSAKQAPASLVTEAARGA